MKSLLLAFACVLVFPILSVYPEEPIEEPLPTYMDCGVNWWCDGCGLLYPIEQKTCLNKDCTLRGKPRKMRR